MNAEEWAREETPRSVPDLLYLNFLVNDAAGRAAAMLAGADPAADDEDPLVDAVRLLATPEGSPHAGRAARLTGLPEDELRGLVLAYRHGGTGVRIRLGPDDRWYPFTFAQDRWWPAPGAAEPPGVAWMAALRARSLRRAGG